MHSSIKKYWLLSSIVYFASQLIDGYFRDPHMQFELGLFFVTFVIPFGYLFIEIFNFIALYLFSYIRHGTVLLTLNMGLSVIRASLLTFHFWFWKEVLIYYDNNPDKNLVLDGFISCVYFLIIVQWFVFSYKLRKENKLIIKNKILSDPECQRLIQELKSVSNFDELSLKYVESVQNCPQIASTLKKIYQQKQIELEKAN